MNPNFIVGTMRWGTWGKNLSEKEVSLLIENLYDENLKAYDLADIYGNYTTEILFGSALKSTQINRENIYLITKLGIQYPCENKPFVVKSYNTTPQYIVQQTENSLKNLQTEYLDLLLIHRPNPLMNYEEVAETFYQLQQQGKVKEFGVSNFNIQEFQYFNSLFPLKTNQVEFSLTNLENMNNGTLLQMQSLKIRPQIWSPLGNYFTENSEQKQRLERILLQLTKKYSVSITEILFAFIHKHPSNPISIIGSSNFARIRMAVNSLNIELESDDWFSLLQFSQGKKVK